MATITVGPVIGLTTRDSVRVLVEVDEDIQVTCIARSGGHSAGEARPLRANRPGAFQLQGLRPGRTYRLEFEGADAVQRDACAR